MRKCYLKVFDDEGELEVALFNREKEEAEGIGLGVKNFPAALASGFSAGPGVYELRSYDEWNISRISFPVHPAPKSDHWPACYGGSPLVNICLPFLKTLLGRVRLKGLLKNEESHIAYVTVKRISD